MVVLTKKEQEIHHLYKEEKLTQRQISQRLNMSQQNVSLILKKTYILKNTCIKTGVVNKSQQKPGSQFWRYHALHFVITPYYFYPRYQTARDRGNRYINYRDWKINLHEKTVELMLRKGFDFSHVDKYESMKLAEESFNKTLFEISNKYGFEFAKEGRISIKLVKQHLANTNSPLAKSQKGTCMQIKGHDGKVWFLLDQSKGHLEHEYTHSGRLNSDVEVLERFFNEIRENEDLSLTGYDKRLKLIEKVLVKIIKRVS